MKKLISILLAIMTAVSFALGSMNAFAASVDKDCTKVLLIGNSYTYYNGLDQMLSKLGDASGRDLLVVSAVKGSSDANALLSSDLQYYAWYNGSRIENGSGKLKNIAAKDFGSINRASKWDYVYLQNNAEAADTGMGDVRTVSLFTDMLEANRNFIINSNYWVESLEKDRLNEHYTVAKATGSSLIDTRGIFAQYHNVAKNRVWFKDLTTRDSRNHPSALGTYVFALSVYAKIFGCEDLPDSENSDRMIPLYNSDNGTIAEIFDISKFKNNYTLNESINKSTAHTLQLLVSRYADEYLGDKIEGAESTRPSLPSSSATESIRYFDENGDAVTGWATLSGYNYRLDNGYILTGGFKDIDDKTYFFSDYGETENGWFTVSDKTYYAFSDGSIAKGWQQLTNKKGLLKTFYFSKSGVLATGKTTIDSKTYYFSKGSTNYTKGEMFTGLHTISNKTYFFNESGVMQKKKLITDGTKTYYADKSGYIQKSKFITIGKKRYYFNSKGVMLKGKLFTSGGRKYYATKKGYLKTGWVKIDSKSYYFAKKKSSTNPKYSMFTGKHKIGKKTYKFTKDGVCTNR